MFISIKKNGFVTITHEFFVPKNFTFFNVAATDKSLKVTMVSTVYTSVSLLLVRLSPSLARMLAK